MMPSREWGNWQMLGKGRVENGQAGSSRGVGFRDYSPWVGNQSQRSEAGGFGMVVCGGVAGMTSFSMGATQSHHFNFSPHEGFGVSAVSFSSLPCLNVPMSLSIYGIHKVQQLYPPAQVDINGLCQRPKLLVQWPNSDMPLTPCEICIISWIQGRGYK